MLMRPAPDRHRERLAVVPAYAGWRHPGRLVWQERRERCIAAERRAGHDADGGTHGPGWDAPARGWDARLPAGMTEHAPGDGQPIGALWGLDDPARHDPGALDVTGESSDPLGCLARAGLATATSREPLPHLDDPDDPPFGLPVLREVPELAQLLTELRDIDRAIARALATLDWLEQTGLAEATTGLGLDAWITLVARRTGADTRMLRTTVRMYRRVPSLRLAFEAGAVSWSQVRAIVLAVQKLPDHLDDRIDAAIAEGVRGAAGATPDDVTRVIRWTLASLDDRATAVDQERAEREEYLAMQPRLDGTGGRLWGELGPASWATVDAALNGPGATPVDVGPTCDGIEREREHGRARSPVARAGAVRLARLVELLDSTLSGGDAADGGPDDGRGEATPRRGSRPQLLLRADLASLLDRAQVPATLLTTLLGGHVRVTADTARTLVAERGADLRTVIVDDTGQVVGVGRRRRLAPAWLREASLALHDTCSEPGCDTAARVCDSDHARPWHPVRPGDPLGRTDIDQLAPLCRHGNVRKERDGWQVEQRADGIRRWTHERSGVTTATVPATWRPPPSDGPGP